MLQPRPTLDVYWTELDGERAAFDRFAGVLSEAERARAARFHFERDRRRYVVRRGTLRALLSRRLGCAAAAIRLSCNPFGKPFVDGSTVKFNVSHSHRMALYVIAHGLEVGCDIEWRDPGYACEPIAERFFSPGELCRWRSVAPAWRTEAFFNGWTRKEAYLKARGHGLSVALDSFEVSLVPGEPACLLRGCAGWSVQSFEPVPGYQAAVVAEGASWRLNLWPPLTEVCRHRTVYRP
jgi:4'-phosphopantetheinyl transferase